jgi:enamine deaminase RidA (YjgF/YER057c/UK114 family)
MSKFMNALRAGVAASTVSVLLFAAAQAQEATPDPEKRLKELGVELPTLPAPPANFVRAVKSGNWVFLSGHGPRKTDGSYITGKLGQDLSIEQGREAARLTAINLLASLKAEIGDLNNVKRFVKVLGMVNAGESFTNHPQVMNGFSDFIVSIFGERGKHARSAVGMASLPNGMAVEIEMIVEIETP